MREPTPITIPLINPNEPGALLAALHVTPGQRVTRGTRLCTLETTKSTQELTAEAEGYLVGLTCKEGDILQAGELLCYLAENPDWLPPARQASSLTRPEGVRISQAALELARQHQLDLSHFSADVFITEHMVRAVIDQTDQASAQLRARSFTPNDLIIYGGGGHGKALIDLVRTLDTYSIAGIIDDGLSPGTSIMGVPVLGGAGSLEILVERGLHKAVNAVGGIGNITNRIKVFDKLRQSGFDFPTLVHPTAFVEPSAALAEGVQVMPHAYIGSEARVGFGVLVNTGAIVSHDCILEEYTNLSPGAILAGEVTVGRATLVGMGATVNLRVNIGARARIGNGATVKQDVPEGAIVHAGTIWPE